MRKLTYIREHWPAILVSLAAPIFYFFAQKIQDPTFGGLIFNEYKQYSPIVLSTIGSLISLNIGNIVIKNVISNNLIRQYINKPYNVEGYWYLQTKFVNENIKSNLASILTYDGIMHISYDIESNEYCVRVRRFDRFGNEIHTESDHCYINGHKKIVDYINYFKVHNTKYLSCICVGKFTTFGNNNINVDRFNSNVYVENCPPLIQNGRKIDFGTVSRMTNEYEDWYIEYIRLRNSA